MKLVLAFEGVDGAGKTSLANFTRKLCEHHNQRFTLISRREAYSDALVGRLTKLLHDESPNLVSQADAFIRVAREYQRAFLAALAPPGVVVLDRFVLSLLALARFHGHDVEVLAPTIRDIMARAQLHATAFVSCPFELARGRVKERNPQTTPKTRREEQFLQQLGVFMEEDFRSGRFTGQQWLLDNSQSVASGEQQLAEYLGPYFPVA